MDRVQLSESVFKKPGYAICMLLATVLSFEAVHWFFAYEKKLVVVSRFGGVLGYLLILIRGAIIPEMVTLIITASLLTICHKLLNYRSVFLSFASILRYELSFLPILLLTFFIANPITQTVRYTLVEFPNYNFSSYWEDYIVGTYTWKLYRIYLVIILIMGYGMLNVSLLIDLIKTSRKSLRENNVVRWS